MAKLFKLSAYLVDHKGTFDNETLEDYLNYCMRHELDIDHIDLDCADIGEWDDDHLINNYNCPKAEYDKYFEENL